MDIRIKQRLIGAVVLVSLAVIFLPIFLDGGGEFSSAIRGSNVPPAPEYAFEPLPTPPPMPAPEDQPGTEAVIDDAVGEPEVTAMSDLGSVSEASPEQKASPVESVPPLVVAKPAASPAPKPIVSGWIVQVGSFASESAAHALRDQLRGKNYHAFVERGRTAAGGPVFRVRVGPELEREDADQLLKKLSRDTGLKGLVQQYP